MVRIFWIGLGGALGAVLRYLINVSPLVGLSLKFPFPTFVINVSGSFLLGLLLTLFAARFDVSENLRLGVTVGFLGALTTFSTFEMEIFELGREKNFFYASLYLFTSIFFGLLAVWSGVWLARRL